MSAFPNFFFITKLCSILKWVTLFFFQELNNMFSDFCATLVVVWNTPYSVVLVPMLRLTGVIIEPGAISLGQIVKALGMGRDTAFGVFERSWVWMKPLPGWEAGDKHEHCNLFPEHPRQMGEDFRSQISLMKWWDLVSILRFKIKFFLSEPPFLHGTGILNCSGTD